jgi:short-subunit dehydrogenase
MSAKSILITGCSSGIGLCAATRLQQRGYRVFATARKAADVARLKTQGLESFILDMDDPNSMQCALDQILQLTNKTLDALFNNAGYMQVGAVQDTTSHMIQAQFATNVFGPMELTRRVLPIMHKQGHGRIIQNSSILGVITLPFYGAYSASKFALEGFSNTLRQELRGTPIHISIINPGPISSKLRDNAYQQYQKTLTASTIDTYQKHYQRLEKNYSNPRQHDIKLTLSPEAVVTKLIHALESPRPRAHYYVGLPAAILAILRRFLPDSSLDWLLSKSW